MYNLTVNYEEGGFRLDAFDAMPYQGHLPSAASWCEQRKQSVLSIQLLQCGDL